MQFTSETFTREQIGATSTLCLWFKGQAKEVATFYTTLLPDTPVDAIHRAPRDYP